jgi:hypothetical protein
MNNNINVRLIRGEVVNGSNNWNNDDLNSSDPTVKLLAVKSAIKVDLTRLLQPVLTGTGIDTYNICDRIIDNLHLDENLLTRIKGSILRSMIFNEVYRVCIQASAITGKDYADYLNNQYIIDDIAEKIIALFNK